MHVGVIFQLPSVVLLTFVFLDRPCSCTRLSYKLSWENLPALNLLRMRPGDTWKIWIPSQPEASKLGEWHETA